MPVIYWFIYYPFEIRVFTKIFDDKTWFHRLYNIVTEDSKFILFYFKKTFHFKFVFKFSKFDYLWYFQNSPLILQK